MNQQLSSTGHDKRQIWNRINCVKWTIQLNNWSVSTEERFPFRAFEGVIDGVTCEACETCWNTVPSGSVRFRCRTLLLLLNESCVIHNMADLEQPVVFMVFSYVWLTPVTCIYFTYAFLWRDQAYMAVVQFVIFIECVDIIALHDVSRYWL